MKKQAIESIRLEYKPDFEQAQQHWDAFWSQQIIDRPCTMICAPKNNSAISPPAIQSLNDEFHELLQQQQVYLETHAFLGEAIPCFRPNFGPDQMAGFLGAPIVMSNDSKATS